MDCRRSINSHVVFISGTTTASSTQSSDRIYGHHGTAMSAVSKPYTTFTGPLHKTVGTPLSQSGHKAVVVPNFPNPSGVTGARQSCNNAVSIPQHGTALLSTLLPRTMGTTFRQNFPKPLVVGTPLNQSDPKALAIPNFPGQSSVIGIRRSSNSAVSSRPTALFNTLLPRTIGTPFRQNVAKPLLVSSSITGCNSNSQALGSQGLNRYTILSSNLSHIKTVPVTSYSERETVLSNLKRPYIGEQNIKARKKNSEVLNTNFEMQNSRVEPVSKKRKQADGSSQSICGKLNATGKALYEQVCITVYDISNLFSSKLCFA